MEMTLEEAKAYIRNLAYAGRVKCDGVSYIARYGKSKRTAQRIEEPLKVLGGKVWCYTEFDYRHSKYDTFRSWCDVTFDVGLDDNWLYNLVRGMEKPWRR